MRVQHVLLYIVKGYLALIYAFDLRVLQELE